MADTSGGGVLANPYARAGAVGLGALQVESMHLANAKGSRWSDPDLRAWDGDSGSLQRFDWRG